MNITIILASGLSTRMEFKIPKQFLKINNKTILEHCVNKFYNSKKIDLILIASKEEWINKIKKIFINYKNIDFCIGGNSRNESIMNAIKYLNKYYSLEDEDIILTHDANRIFVDEKIINNNIIDCQKYKCVITGITSSDTIYKFNKNKIIDILDRDELLNAQTPQTFSFKKIKDIFENVDYKKFNNIDLGTLAYLNNEKIYISKGSVKNFKITYKEDYVLAKKILNS